jgi:hypothetical protein
MMNSSGHGQLPGSCRCEGFMDGWLRFTAARDSAPARGARVRMVAAARTRGPPLPERASKGPCLLRPLARLLRPLSRLLQADRVRLLTAESGANEQCPPATKGRYLAATVHGRSTVAVRLFPNLPQALHPAASSCMGLRGENGHGVCVYYSSTYYKAVRDLIIRDIFEALGRGG